MKALLIAPAWVGDTVMAQPLLARLKHYQPDLQIDALAPRWVAPVLQRMPEIASTLDNPFAHGQLRLRDRWRLGRQLAEHGYEACWVLPNSLKSALLPAFAGIPKRVGFTGEARYGLLNCRHDLDKLALPLMVERFAQLAEAPGAALPRPVPFPRLQSTTEQQQATLAALQLDRPPRLVVLSPGAEYGPAKRWPTAHFASVTRALLDRNVSVWLLGSGKDAEIAEAIRQQAGATDDPFCRNLCGVTGLDQAIDLIALADAMICNDSGLMHVAAAVDRPIIALYGSSSPGFTPPLSGRATILSRGLECSPCFKRTCPLGHLHCLTELRPEEVLAALPENLQ